jgi:hypothetical protein
VDNGGGGIFGSIKDEPCGRSRIRVSCT